MTDFKVVTSKDNSLIKLVSSLQTSRKARKEHGMFVLEGARICDDAFDNGIGFDKLIVSNTAFLRLPDYIEKFKTVSKELYKIPDSLFERISDTSSPQGIIAICSHSTVKSAEIRRDGRYIALENVSDPSNLGAVARTAEALGVSGIILSGGCDPFSPKALRASMGTLLRMPVSMWEDFSVGLKSCGLKSYACVVDGNAEKIGGIQFEDGCLLLIGNEANGLSESAVSGSDVRVTIPMSGRAESLNAAAAAAIAMWEMMK